MRKALAERALFWREFRTNFHTTGAVLPSGRRLATELARYVAEGNGPRRILEAGPGTGAVTAQLLHALHPSDRLDLVELNPQFVAALQYRFQHDPHFRQAADRVSVLQQAVEQLPEQHTYDVIVSGLPLNNFSVELVERILAAFTRQLKPGGILSFFEYIAVRRAKRLVVSRSERTRLHGIDTILSRTCRLHEFRRQAVLINVPPAWVHHLRFGRALSEGSN
jgi:phospholipid N-methyltransferase